MGYMPAIFILCSRIITKHNEKWRKIWGKEDAAERDMETLLRLCALKKYVGIERKDSKKFDFSIENYHGS